MYVCVSFLLIFSTTVHPINFTLGGCIAEDLRQCSSACEVVWMSGSPESCKQESRKPTSFVRGTVLVYINVHLCLLFDVFPELLNVKKNMNVVIFT